MHRNILGFEIEAQCPGCESPRIKSFSRDGSYDIELPPLNTSGTVYTFVHYPMCCTQCGLIFNGCRTREESLRRYYLDQFSHKYEAFDTQKRLNFLHTALGPEDVRGRRLLDFGGNQFNDFHQTLTAEGFDVRVHDVGDISDGKRYDVIASYFVFEHLRSPLRQLRSLAGDLAEGGTIIIEVPDIELYGRDHSGLYAEHLNHFHRHSLGAMFRHLGFVVVADSNELCSRNFGFAAAFRRASAEIGAPQAAVTSSFLESVQAHFESGRELQRLEMEKYRMLIAKLIEWSGHYEQILLWGLNPVFFEIVKALPRAIAAKIVCIDSDERKRQFADSNGCGFATETEASDLKTRSTVILILASDHVEKIKGKASKRAASIPVWVFNPILSDYLSVA